MKNKVKLFYVLFSINSNELVENIIYSVYNGFPFEKNNIRIIKAFDQLKSLYEIK